MQIYKKQRKSLDKKTLQLLPLFWNMDMYFVTSCENALFSDTVNTVLAGLLADI